MMRSPRDAFSEGVAAPQKYRTLQAALIALVAVLALAGMGLSPHPPVILVGGLALIAILLLMWTDSGPSIFLLPCMYQWSEVAVKPMLSAIEQRPLADFQEYSGDLQASAIFGFAGIVLFALGLRLGFGRT